MTRKMPYFVSILNAVTGRWRTVIVRTMADCVRLTLGLATDWEIRGNDQIVSKDKDCIHERWRSRVTAETTNTLADDYTIKARYLHSIRSLVNRWAVLPIARHLLRANDYELLQSIGGDNC